MTNKFIERVDPKDPKQHQLYIEHLARYVFVEKYINSKDLILLDAGCGNGYGTKRLAETGVKRAVGIDNSSQAIDYAQKHYQRKNLEFKKMDCLKLEFSDQSFDLIIAFELIEHLKNPAAFLKQAKRVLKDKGIAIISTPNKNIVSPNSEVPENPFHQREFSFSEFKYLLKDYFSKITFFSQDISTKHLEAEHYYQQLQQQINFIQASLIQGAPFWKKKRTEKEINLFKKKIGPIKSPRINLKDIIIEPHNLDNAYIFIAVAEK